ncbi:CapA family protein [Haliscomenobacter sp.]|uniref:CapA family protein n=1 Tax=Haliscomenobacter sp. TaxID=2717303 RepID=UPI003BABB691
MKKVLPFFVLLFVLSQLSAQDKLKMIFVGDIMGHGPQIESAAIEPNKLYDYSPCFRFIAPLLEQSDLAIGNLELTLPGKPPYTGYPTFKSPDELPLALRAAGFDLLVTANNHSNDGGLIGVQNTIKTLEKNGFYQTGTFIDSSHRAALYPLIVYKGNFKLAFLNYTYGTNGIPNHKPSVVNLIDEKAIKADIDAAKAHKPDAIITVVHWGDEYQLAENERQRALAQKMLNWGSTMVIGAHPHVVQPIKNYPLQETNGATRNGLVVYSMGNFISAQTKTYTDIGLMVEIELEKKGSIQESAVSNPQTMISKVEYIPVYRYIYRPAAGKPVYMTVPVAAFENGEMQAQLPMPEATRVAMKQSADVIRKNLTQHGAVERKVSAKEISTEK